MNPPRLIVVLGYTNASKPRQMDDPGDLYLPNADSACDSLLQEV